MGQRIVLPTKTPGTTQFVPAAGWDFISLLQVGETISTAVVTAGVWSGNDPNAAAIISGAASISGTKVLQLITAGVLGCIYGLKCAITTSLGQTLNLYGYLAIIPDISIPLSSGFIQTDAGINLTTDAGVQLATSN